MRAALIPRKSEPPLIKDKGCGEREGKRNGGGVGGRRRVKCGMRKIEKRRC